MGDRVGAVSVEATKLLIEGHQLLESLLIGRFVSSGVVRR